MRLEQTIHVTFRYTAHFTRGLFQRDNRTLADILSGRHPKAVVFLDSGLAQARPPLREEIEEWFRTRAGEIEVRALAVIQGGEKCKDEPKYHQQVVQVLRDSGLDRHSYVVIVGGTAVLDGVGFAASILRGGLRCIRVPTTVLAQSSPAVTTGINLLGVKNLARTFAPPWAVVNDFNFLRTLSPRDRTAGLAEAFKLAIIKDRGLFSFLTTKAEALREGEEGALEQMILRCAELHAAHLRSSGLPFEAAAGPPLDFGHWSALWLETATGYELRHGEALAVGIALDLTIARNRRLIGPAEFESLVCTMRTAGLLLWHPLLKSRDAEGGLCIRRGLEEFRRHLGEELSLLMPSGLGQSCRITDLSDTEIERAVEELEGVSTRPVREPGYKPPL
jgi:3-dehydroquinate synthase